MLGRLYRPAGEVHALVVEVHGGAWVMNDRTANAVIHEYLASRGIAVFALDFRLAPKHRYPASIEDVNFGIRWMKANAARLGLRPRLFGGLGTSSGGQQLLLNALVPERHAVADPALAGFDAKLDFVVACWPILDPLARYRMARAKGLKNLVDAHHAFWPNEAAMAQGNPYLLLDRGEATYKPRMLVLQGTADENVEHERADAFAERYRASGGEIELVKFLGEPHTFIIKNPTSENSTAALAKIASYIHG
ncbi:MAG TPA: alpha/beta hydrolase [Burkholderiales bacterium]|nr:alpha/beta hydrolase [Burkholderiales bacterium]